MKLGIVGGGVVGQALASAWTGHVEQVRVHDVRPERATHPESEVMACDAVFICLPTPQQPGGSLAADLTAVDRFFDKHSGSTARMVLRSTVPIGTTKRLAKQHGLINLLHSPEFLTARTAAQDAANPTRNVIGFTRPSVNCQSGDPFEWDDHWFTEMCRKRWPAVPIFKLWSDESEAVKLFQNSFSAVKIALLNEFRQLCLAKEMDWQDVREALLAGGWINPMHTDVPGPDGKPGFGGSCLPKDLASLISCNWEVRLDPAVCRAALIRNVKDRKGGAS